MRFTTKFTGEEATIIKEFLKRAEIGGHQQLSLQDFTKHALRKELNYLKDLMVDEARKVLAAKEEADAADVSMETEGEMDETL